MEDIHKIFDGHNDVLFRLYLKNKKNAELDFINGDNEGHLDLPRIVKAGFSGGFFAIYIPSQEENIVSADTPIRYDDMKNNSYELPLPKEIATNIALPIALEKAVLLTSIEKKSIGKIKICKSSNDLTNAISNNQIAVIMHIEGAECIDKNFNNLELLFNLGLRSIGPVWSRPTIFGHGVPFKFPSSPDTGEGLTDLGKELIRHCNRMGIIIDLSHLNEKGFWDTAKISSSPLVATHSNAHTICPHSRNLTDKQLDAIKDTDGMVGVNFAPAFLRPDGKMLADTDLELIIKHFDYLIERLGENRVGFGSDFDGALMPNQIKDVVDLSKIRSLMKSHGYNQELMKKICQDNWIKLAQKIIN